jgi:hypothetical protein
MRRGAYESDSPFFLKRHGRRVCDFCMASLTERKRVYLDPRWYWLCESCQAGYPAKPGRTLTARIRARRMKPMIGLVLRGLALCLAWLLTAQPVWAAIAFVQSTGVDTLNNGGGKTISFGTLPSAGDFIAVAICGIGGIDFVIQSVTDNQGDTYSLGAKVRLGGGQAGEAAIYYTANIPAPSGTFSITVNPTETVGNNISMVALAYTGMEDTDVVDVTATNATASPTDASVGPSSSTTVNDTLVLALGCMWAASVDISPSDPSSGYTSRGVQENGVLTALSLGEKIESSTGAQSASWTHDDADTGSVLVAFKAAGGSPPIVTGTADATLSWVEPTLNQDGSPLMDLSNTQGFYRRPASSSWVSCITKNAPSVTGGASQSGTCTVPIPAGTTENVDFVVRPYDQRGNEGTWTSVITKPLTGS